MRGLAGEDSPTSESSNESDQEGAGSPRKRMDARRKDEGGLEDDDDDSLDLQSDEPARRNPRRATRVEKNLREQDCEECEDIPEEAPSRPPRRVPVNVPSISTVKCY